MQIIGCDLHARQQTLAMLDTGTGEVVNRTLTHEGNNVREFYSTLPAPVRVGIEATGSMKWFLQLMEELGIDCQVGHPATIRAAEPRRQKHDQRDAELLLKLLVENRFPSIWQPSQELLDLRGLLLHRHQWVRLRTRIQNALQAIALANGLRRGSSLWSQSGQDAIASLPLATPPLIGAVSCRRCTPGSKLEIEQLNQQVLEQADQRPTAEAADDSSRCGADHGPGDRCPFWAIRNDFATARRWQAISESFPEEHSSGGRQRLGGLSKQGNPLLRFLWCEAAARCGVAEIQKLPSGQFYRRKLVQKGLGKARVAAARKLGIRLWIMLRDRIDYHEFCRRGQMQQKSGGACAGMPRGRYGAKSHRLID